MFERIPRKISCLIKTYQEKKDLDFRLKEYARLAHSYKKYMQIKLHFGCGPRVLKDWINIDITFAPFEKYMKDYTNEHYPEAIRSNRNDFFAINIFSTGLPLPDNSVDAIFHEDFIEHINQRDQIVFLAETFRVMKKGAIHRINTPDLQSSMKEYSNFNKGMKGVHVYEWNKWHHLNILTKNTLKELATMVGYSDIIFNEKNKSISSYTPTEYRPSSRKGADGNLFADLIK